MIITYRTPAGSGSYTTLANETTQPLADAISQYQIDLTKSPQTATGYGATIPVTLDLGNARWSLGFTVDRVHASPDAALLFTNTHMLALGEAANFDLQITVGSQVLYLAACCLTKLTPAPHSDQSTQFKYTFTGGQYQTTAP